MRCSSGCLCALGSLTTEDPSLSMSAEQCPICFSRLEAREVAPCMDCGHDLQELQHFAEARHTYAEYRIFESLSLVLCSFCRIDFGSYDPTYFGLPASARIGFERMSFVCDVVPPPCSRRSPLLMSLQEFASFVSRRSFHVARQQTA